MAAAPGQSLAGVESQQLAHPALPRIPARHPPAGDGIELPGRRIGPVCLAAGRCSAALGEAGGAAVPPPFVVS